MKKCIYLASLFILLSFYSAKAQTLKALSYDVSNNVIAAATNTNPITFRNPLAWATNSHRDQTRTNLSLGATWLTNTNVTNFRTAIGLGATNDAEFSSLSLGSTVYETTEFQIFLPNSFYAELSLKTNNTEVSFLQFGPNSIVINKPLAFHNAQARQGTFQNLGVNAGLLFSVERPTGTAFTDIELKGTTNNFTNLAFYFQSSLVGSTNIGEVGGLPRVWFTDSSWFDMRRWKVMTLSPRSSISAQRSATTGTIGGIVLLITNANVSALTNLTFSYHWMSSTARDTNSAGQLIWRPIVPIVTTTFNP